MTAARPVGRHIRNICAVLEAIGPASGRALLVHIDDIDKTNISKYCSRGVGLGLITCKVGKSRIGNANVYTVVTGWREIADKRRTTKLDPMPQPARVRSAWQGVNSVFSIAA